MKIKGVQTFAANAGASKMEVKVTVDGDPRDLKNLAAEISARLIATFVDTGVKQK